MNVENTMRVGLARLRERQRETKQGKDGCIDDDHERNVDVSRENIQRKRSERTRNESTISPSQDLSTRLKKSRDVDEKDVSKEDDENVEITKKKPSKRRLKKEKAAEMAIQKKRTDRISAMQKALSYVSMWKHSRNEWKFEKLKQIWLMDNLLDGDSIPDTIFPVVLEYFEGCKGMAREVLLKKGMEVVRKAEEKENENDRIEIMESTAYKRARQLLQALPSDR